MKYGDARVSTGGRSVEVHVRQLTRAGRNGASGEVASGWKADCTQLRWALDQFDARDGEGMGEVRATKSAQTKPGGIGSFTANWPSYSESQHGRSLHIDNYSIPAQAKHQSGALRF
jgi:hypothetical protein